jgi:hypothetical protein
MVTTLVLPDGIFSNQKNKVLEGLAMEDVGIYSIILSILKAKCYIL